jgi:glycosyltransferase involved in cell wall biosynthesis
MYRIALVMIVRNEARCLQRCLDSARSWVDEMWVLDTGSTDATLEIAQSNGAGVAQFKWCDDFAAARNAALTLTDADWCVVLDADEWIRDGGESLAALRHQAPDFLGQISVSSLVNNAVRQTHDQAPSWLTRVLPRGVRYEGRVHEQPVGDLPRRKLALTVMHDGYLPEHMQAKQGRNQHLLSLALADQPQDAYLNYQLGKDFEVRGEFALAQPHFEIALQRGEAQAGWRHDLVLRALFTLKKLNRFEAALALAQTEMPNWPTSPDFFFTLGDVFLDWAATEPARAGDLLPMAESSWLQAHEIGEQPLLQDSVSGRGSHLAAHNLAVLYDGWGAPDQAQHWRERSRACSPEPSFAAA